MYTSHFTPLQLQFYATTNIQLTILPSTQETQIYLMGKIVGPFRPNQQIDVPSWLAIFLKQQHKCKIVVPELFTIQQLTKFVQAENNSPDPTFLHTQCFFELAFTLLNKAPDTFTQPRQVRNLVQSLQTIRFEKLRKLIENTTGGRRLKYFTSFQINKWRSGLSNLQKMVDKLAQQQ